MVQQFKTYWNSEGQRQRLSAIAVGFLLVTLILSNLGDRQSTIAFLSWFAPLALMSRLLVPILSMKPHRTLISFVALFCLSIALFTLIGTFTNPDFQTSHYFVDWLKALPMFCAYVVVGSPVYYLVEQLILTLFTVKIKQQTGGN